MQRSFGEGARHEGTPPHTACIAGCGGFFTFFKRPLGSCGQPWAAGGHSYFAFNMGPVRRTIKKAVCAAKKDRSVEQYGQEEADRQTPVGADAGRSHGAGQHIGVLGGGR